MCDQRPRRVNNVHNRRPRVVVPDLAPPRQKRMLANICRLEYNTVCPVSAYRSVDAREENDGGGAVGKTIRRDGFRN